MNQKKKLGKQKKIDKKKRVQEAGLTGGRMVGGEGKETERGGVATPTPINTRRLRSCRGAANPQIFLHEKKILDFPILYWVDFSANQCYRVFLLLPSFSRLMK